MLVPPSFTKYKIYMSEKLIQNISCENVELKSLNVFIRSVAIRA